MSVPFPSLAAVVDEWREGTCEAKPSHGVPPHVTLLLPVPDDRDAIRRALAGFAPFDVVFNGFGRFESVLWLAPDPADVFVAMTEALMNALPGCLPYGGGFEEITPHLTVAQADLDTAEAAVGQSLPVSARVESVSLFEQVAPPNWREVATFEL